MGTIIGIIVLGGIVVIIWGGYHFWKKHVYANFVDASIDNRRRNQQEKMVDPPSYDSIWSTN